LEQLTGAEGGVGKNYANHILDKGPEGGQSHVHPTFDAWEHKKGEGVFDSAMAQGTGLYSFAKLVDQLSFKDAASVAEKYRTEGKRIVEHAFNVHWDPQQNAYVSIVGRHPIFNPGDTSNLDALTVMSLVHSKTTHEFVPLEQDRVLATVHATEEAQRRVVPKEAQTTSGALPILRTETDKWKGVVGAHGQQEDGIPGHYPWNLLTSVWGNYYATITQRFIKSGEIHINDTNRAFFEKLLHAKIRTATGPESYLDPRYLWLENGVLKRGDAYYTKAIETLQQRADDYMKMVTDTVQPDGTTAEGFDPISKKPLGPPNLAWNYAEFLEFKAEWEKMHQTLDTYAF
jgi:GH15 family glucan-1,4-alpha-glucosidase